MGIPYDEALKSYQQDKEHTLPEMNELLGNYHPDYYQDSVVELQIGANRGDPCHSQLAEMLHADARIDEADLAGTSITETNILVIGGGGAGCAAALTAARNGAKVILATKLRLGDSNTVMAEGGIQASIEPDDTPQAHYNDTLKAGHNKANKKLVATMVMEAPDVIRWLIQEGMQFDQNEFGDLLTRRPGGASADRIVYYRDYTGLEMMRVLREAVYNTNIEVWDHSPVVELLSSETGHCAGAVVYSLEKHAYKIIKAQAVILATGGIGRMHINGFPTTNHFGATGDGLVLAYRLGAKLRDLDSFQYHPTSLAYPSKIAGSLITEGVRSAGVQLLNGVGERFVDELKPRDYISAAILRECAEGRGVQVDEKTVGVWLDTPNLELRKPGLMKERFPKLFHLAKQGKIDPTKIPLLVYPALHYQNGGVVIDENGQTTVPDLYCVGEVSGGIHGRNRIMGNALLEIICFGRRAGALAAQNIIAHGHKKSGIEHLSKLRRDLSRANLPMDVKSPMLFPACANFEL
ncbi:L-aspartate oxidase [Candidatus Thiomargarita nelsonii]|uniref:L-aspartate oxidase n=1 Tax=Candidatus Thiomargarita nelsonii TaxID=1003181 RepID=A0A0A6P781_9GAMM|nr:L-aspartate oxidase [Candidatus Thiomargarita nelsonii]